MLNRDETRRKQSEHESFPKEKISSKIVSPTFP